MRDSIGGSALLSLVVIIVSAVLLLIVGCLSYSKAFKVKNRIINIIEKYNTFQTDNGMIDEINQDLSTIGYGVSSASNQCENTKVYKNLSNKKTGAILNKDYNPSVVHDTGNSYEYCVYKVILKDDTAIDADNPFYYVVVTFSRINFPVIGNGLSIEVSGETIIFNKNYD